MNKQDTSQWDKEGGSAFPIPASDLSGSYEPEPGMSLRDYFAAKAMAAFNANPGSWGSPNVNDEEIAKMAYRQADAMLAERDKPTP